MRRSAVPVLAAIQALPGFAGTLRVPEDYPSVLAAVDAAVSGDSVVVGPGTWTDKETRIVFLGGSPVTITGCGFLKGGISVIGAGVDVTTVDAGRTGAGLVIPFTFANYLGEEVMLQGLTIAGAGATGKAVSGKDAGRLVIRSCRLNETATSQVGGAAIGLDRCDLLLEDSEISFNDSPAVAGVYASNSDIQILRCRFEGNQGRVVELVGPPTNRRNTAVILDSEFVGNRMTSGPGVSVVDFQSVQIERNLFLRNVANPGAHAGLGVGNGLPGGLFGTVRFNTFAYDSAYGGGNGSGATGLVFSGFNGDISYNTFIGCHADPASIGSAILGEWTNGGIFNFSNNIIAGCTGAGAVAFYSGSSFPGSCNGFWDNEGGIGDYVPAATDLFLDPRFCDPSNLDFALDANSPYAAGNSATCGQIGAFGVGCGSVAVQATTWGRLKSLYR
ncbi:MAG: right-handed parallel beta-helix repeat-containing protein [Candidatus Eiseniibacteriota bacterium]